jgi:hypothetical protein
MRRLNVQHAQIEECIRLSMFAVDMLPVNPPLQRGEELLLQLVKSDASRLNLESKRIQFALVFDHVEEDPTEEISRRHWPLAGKTWKHILYCSETIPTIPFSLERLNLGRDYQGQTNPIYIQPEDEVLVRPYLKGRTPSEELTSLTSVDDLLGALRNYDTVVRLAPTRTSRVAEHERRLNDPWLGNTLKILYEHRCQICVHDFKPRYGIPFADIRFIQPIALGGEPLSRHLVVLCPNHDAIIGATGAEFEGRLMAFRFPNGLVEKLTLRDHLLSS